MRAVTANANLVELETLQPDGSLTAVLARRALEAASRGEGPLGLWFDIAADAHEHTMRLTVEMSASDVRETLRRSTGDDVVLALDAQSLGALYDDPDFEAHGLRGALAIAVAVAAVAAPTGVAANRESATTAVKPQVVRTDVKPEVARTDLTRQVVRTAVKPQVAHTALKPQVAHTALAGRMSHLVVTAAGVNAAR